MSLLCAKFPDVLLHRLLVAGVHEHSPTCYARIKLHRSKHKRGQKRAGDTRTSQILSELFLHV